MDSEQRKTLKATFKGWTYANILGLPLEELCLWAGYIRSIVIDPKKATEIPHSATIQRFVWGLNEELGLYSSQFHGKWNELWIKINKEGV